MAATIVLSTVVVMERWNETMRVVGLTNTLLQRRMTRPMDSAAGRENISTPAEAADLMIRIARCELPMSAELCADLRAVLEMPKEIPGSIPTNLDIAWKGGSKIGRAHV